MQKKKKKQRESLTAAPQHRGTPLGQVPSTLPSPAHHISAMVEGNETRGYRPSVQEAFGRPPAPATGDLQQIRTLLTPVLVPAMGTVGIVRMPTWTEGVEPPVVVASEVHLKRGAVWAGVGLPEIKTIAFARRSRIEYCLVKRSLRPR